MKNIRFLRMTYLAGFFFAFHTALTVYINSSFLADKIPESTIGGLYTAAAILSIIGLYIVPNLITRFGTKKVLGPLLIINIFNILALIFSNNIFVIIICFVLFFSFNTVLYLGYDIIIEHWSTHSVQGTVRGAYLTALSVGIMLAPFITGYIIDRLGYGSLYGISVLFLMPVIFITLFRLPNITESHPSKLNFFRLANKFLRNSHLRGVFLVNTLLQFFYVWMTIYTPLYLHEHAGIGWDTIGLIFTIMLSAFIFFEYLFGKIADTYHAEKLIMTLGLFTMGIATLFVIQAPLLSFWGLTLVFFVTRIGACAVEVSTESYFFKQVRADDVGTIGFFRNTYPFASLIAAILGSGLLLITPIRNLFVILGIMLLAGGIAMTIHITLRLAHRKLQ